MTADTESFPCPSCGFEVFSSLPGSFEICEICGWEDDHVQLRFPALAGGANKLSLADHQKRALEAFPSSLSLAKGFRRASSWRPLAAAEVTRPPVPMSGHDYVAHSAEDAPPYYWSRSAFEPV
jgi:cysteine-rich CPCC protein